MDCEIDYTFEEIKHCINESNNFCLDAGAGSGKTYTLINVINYIITNFPNRKIVCITYTNNAKDEILSRLSTINNISVSTIHDFIWKNICKFQSHLRLEVNNLIDEKIIKLKADGDSERLEKYKNADLALPISYRDYESLRNGIISHDTLLKIFVKFLCNEQFCNIMFSSFDYIFIDEYQDTHNVIFSDFLKCFQNFKIKQKNILIGLFGDFMQNIYNTGIGQVADEFKDWFVYIKKKDNYRSCKEIIKFNNCLRDDLKQECKNQLKVKGEIKFIYNLSDDPYLNKTTGYEFYKRLHLTHRVIADEICYSELYKVYSDKYGNNTSNILKNADERFLKYICNEIMPSIYEFKSGMSNKIIKNIRREFINFDILNVLKVELTDIVSDIASVSIDVFLNRIFELKIFSSINYMQLCQSYIDSDDEEFLSLIKNLSAIEFYNYYLQFSDKTMLQTMHGTKGNEFDNVLININENTPWNWYNFSKYLKKEKLTESVRQRTSKLLYVSCTRAKKSLIINYIVESENSKEESSINLMKNNIISIWGDNIEFIINN